MKRDFFVSLLIFFVYSSLLFSQNIQFTRESIEVVIGPHCVFINGIYYFRNNNNQEITRSLFYPFPLNEILLYPDTIQVFDKDNNPLIYRRSPGGIRFSISSPPDSEISISVKYSQRFLSNEVKYILKSTQTWKQPLLKAEYKVLLPLEFELKQISLRPGKMESNSTYNIYYIYKENFMPDNDLIIKWAGRE